MSIEEPLWVDEVKSSTYDLRDLPKDIEKNILDYLKLEFAPDNQGITITYVGEYTLWGKPIKCWDFGDDKQYVTVQPAGNGYYIGFTSNEVSSENKS